MKRSLRLLIFLALAISGISLCNSFEGKVLHEPPGFKLSETILDSPDIEGTQDSNDEQIVVNEELVTSSGSNVDKLNSLLEGSGAGDLHHEFTSEEIERHRIITIHGNGTETISSDEEAILTLEYVHLSESSSFLHSEPHFVNQKIKRTVFGHDDRSSRNQNSPPYSAMGYLFVNGINFRCSAFLVGPQHLLTAAHCLHPEGNPRNIVQPSQISFYLRRACNPYYAGIRRGVEKIEVYHQYKNNGNIEYDIAYLLLSSTVSNWMGFAFRDPMPTVSGEVCGYSSDLGQCFTCSRCSDIQRPSIGWWGWGGKNNKRLHYTCDTYRGSSGGPVTTGDYDSTNNQYAYGVNAQQNSCQNSGVRISRDFFIDICHWRCQQGAKICDCTWT